MMSVPFAFCPLMRVLAVILDISLSLKILYFIFWVTEQSCPVNGVMRYHLELIAQALAAPLDLALHEMTLHLC
jgi:hypothetical protein